MPQSGEGTQQVLHEHRNSWKDPEGGTVAECGWRPGSSQQHWEASEWAGISLWSVKHGHSVENLRRDWAEPDGHWTKHCASSLCVCAYVGMCAYVCV